MNSVLDKDILTNHYLNELSLFAVAHNDIISAPAVFTHQAAFSRPRLGFSCRVSPWQSQIRWIKGC
jgi:hypothetical protein